MNFSLSKHMLDATRLTRSGNLMKATAVLQRSLSSGAGGTTEGEQEPALTIDGVAVDLMDAPAAVRDRDARGGRSQFLTRSYAGGSGGHGYKLYVPSGYHGQAVPLVVMLHGCLQSPDDFAAGTRMNEAAEASNFLVAYPSQTAAANMQKCWNWFRTGDQRRDAGEPLLLAGITREVMADYAVDARRVFIAGFSAGGAAAAIMGQAYSELFAAIGVHSGLACGAAHDMGSALAAMHGTGAAPSKAGNGPPGRIVPSIIFHGDSDNTVRAGNAEHVAMQSAAGALAMQTESGRFADGMRYSRTLYVDVGGRAVVEKWMVHGAGHAWFGGSPAGSYTLARGPDATAEMVRFFMSQPA